WQSRLAALDFERLDVEGRIDATLLRTRLAHERSLLARDTKRTDEITPLLPFAADIARLQESRHLLEPIDPRRAAATLDAMRTALEQTRAALEAGLKPAKGSGDAATEKAASDEKKANEPSVAPLTTTKVIAFRAASRLDALRGALEDWFKTYDGYDPQFGWWAREPHKQFLAKLDDYKKFLREKIVGIDAKARDDPIVGDPIGRDGLMEELANEMIAYTPEELIALAEREFTWVDTELKRAAREMGCGDDWKAALEKVKEDHVEPGQ